MINGEATYDDIRSWIQYKQQRLDKKQRQQICKDAFAEYNIPMDITADILVGRRDVKEFPPKILFGIINTISPSKIQEYFTSEEIRTLSNIELEIKEAKLPYVFEDIVQITDDQWVGRIDVKTLMDLRDRQMINYKENSQRVMQHLISGGIETLRIFVNKTAVKLIANLMKSGRYIPDDITLNIPDGDPDGESEFKYDVKRHRLTVTKLPNSKFDILDGYHRYLGMSQVYNEDNNFNYPMEIRVTNFQLSKAQQFVFQKDQKTKMKKVESDSYDQYSVANRIVSLINGDPACYLHGQIGRAGEIISSVDMAIILKKLIIPDNIKPENEGKYIITEKQNLVKQFNSLIDQRPQLMSTKWETIMLYSALAIFANENIPEESYGDIYDEMMDKLKEMKVFTASKKSINKNLLTTSNNIMERWG